MSNHNRRHFLKRAAAGGLAAFTIAGTKASARVLGANDRIRIAVVGIGGRGGGHIAAYCKNKKDVEIAYLVDVDSRHFKSCSKTVLSQTGDRPKCLQDMRKILDDKDLDAVSIATPNYWHSLQGIWCLQAGKDVYIEKPCSHNVYEGRKLVEAAQKYDKCIIQHGTQSRSDPDIINTIAAVHGGKYGKLRIAYGAAGKVRHSLGFKPPKAPPKELDFDLWLGPAPKQPYHENIVHYNWHWFWDFGNGEIGNQGVHQMDIARWAMPKGAAPQSVVSLGGRFDWKDQGQTPNTQLSVIDFGEAKIIFEDRNLIEDKTMLVTNEFYMEGGVIKHGKFFPNGKTKGEPLPAVEVEDGQRKISLTGEVEKPSAGKPFKDPQTGHFRNFLDCVRSRKKEDQNAPILEGHLSSLLSHISNISYRLGTDVAFHDPVDVFGNDPAAYEALGSMKQHLAAKLDLSNCKYRLGRKLKFDAAAEKFVGNAAADKLLTRPYRAPYVVPEKV